MKTLRRLVGTSLVLALWSCSSGGGGGAGGDAGVQGPQTVKVALFGQVVDTQGRPVSGAVVRAGEASATSGSDGRFQMRATAGDVVVRTEAEGFLPGIEKTTISSAAPTALAVTLLKQAAAIPLDADAGGEVIGQRKARVQVPAGGLVTRQGLPVSGEVQVHLTAIDPGVGAELAAAPGDFEARLGSGSMARLISYGVLDVTIRQDGEKLQVAPGERFEIEIPAPASEGAPPDSMPLWAFDEALGIWVEEGALQYVAEAHTYRGEITHMSYWNADVAYEATCIEGVVLDKNSRAPQAGSFVDGRGVDYFGRSSTHTDAQGRFALAVRPDSEIIVLAAHQMGGGQERTVRSGSALGGTQPRPGDAHCVDVGEWLVAPGSVQMTDGSARVCDTGELQRFAACIPLQVELGTCFNPVGSCRVEGGDLLLSDIVYENGARMSTAWSGAAMEMTYWSASGAKCGVVESGMDGMTVTLPDGRSQFYAIQLDDNTGTLTFSCADGSTMTFTEEDSAVLQACTGATDEEECTGGGGAGSGESCSSTSDCPGSQICCGGVMCVEEAYCPVGIGCQRDDECAGAQICCAAAGDTCMTQESCAQEGGCSSDSDCGQGVCCDGRCDPYADFCEQGCTSNLECGGERPLCCTSAAQRGGDSYCTDDFENCWQGERCTVGDAAACGGPGTDMTCCPSGQGGEGECLTETSCYAGSPCGAEGDCFGSLVCCTNEAVGYEDICMPADVCGMHRPCGDGFPACGADLLCCEHPGFFDEDYQARFGTSAGCLSELWCYHGRPCEGRADCGGNFVCCDLTSMGLESPLCTEREGCEAQWELP